MFFNKHIIIIIIIHILLLIFSHIFLELRYCTYRYRITSKHVSDTSTDIYLRLQSEGFKMSNTTITTLQYTLFIQPWGYSAFSRVVFL